MNTDVILQLSIAKQYAHHASFAGSPRQAVADGYSAIDATFSALLVHDGKEPPKNHKQKLKQVQESFPNAFVAESVQKGDSWYFAPGTDWESLSEFYQEWLRSRYSDFSMDPGAASSRVREALNVVLSGIRFIAKKEQLELDLLDQQVTEAAFGYQFSEVSAAVSDAHELLFQTAETQGDQYGSKLGTKLAATTNFCDLDVIAGDRLTQQIILQDKDIAEEAALVYYRFNQLVEQIQLKRLQIISGGKSPEQCTPEEIIDTHDFMLSMKARYHGGVIPVVGVPWSKVLAGVSSLALGAVDSKESTNLSHAETATIETH